MHIVHYIDLLRLERGGPVRATIDLCEALSDVGHRVTLITCDAQSAPKAWEGPESGTPTVVELRHESAPGRALGRAARSIASKIIASADALHLHGTWDLANVQLAAIARKHGVPYFVSVRGMLDDWSMSRGGLKKRLFLALAGRSFLEKAAAVHLTAEAELSQARKWFPNGRGVVIPNLLNLDPYRDPPGADRAVREFPLLSDSRPTILFLSRVHHKKNIESLIQAIGELRESGEHVDLIVAGEGEKAYVAYLKSYAASLGLDDRIAFVGHVGGELKVSLYQAADLFVLPTRQENFGFVFFEALASGTPVITTRGVDTWPELEASGGAQIVELESLDSGGLAAAIAELLRDRVRLGKMGRRGRRWVFKNLDPSVIVGRFEALYRRDPLDHREPAA